MFLLFRALPLLWQLGIGLSVFAAIGGAFTWNQVHQYNKGYSAAISAVAAQDQEAVDAKDKAVARVAECRAAGRVWNVTSGVCEGG